MKEKKKQDKGIPVSERALCQRINRKLAKSHQTIKKSRTAQMQTSVGDYYRLDLHKNYVAEHDVDLTALAKELGVLQPWEYLNEGGN